jgi:hypothetical protein
MTKNNSNRLNILFVSVIALVVLVALRFASSVTGFGPVFDEQYIIVPINNIMEFGWTVETAIDFQETKGPAMIWPYAFIGKLLGGTLNDLRLVSLFCSVLSAAVLAWISLRWFSLSRNELVLVAIGWLLLPYNIVFSELVMGESSFLLLSLLAVAVFVWGVEKNAPKSRSFYAPLLYCIIVAIALHSRIHVVALTGGICFTAFALQGRKSWPWWAASIIAGLLRIPLWLRWDGLVSPEYQSLHGLGFRLESLSYLAAAMVPFVGVFAIEGWRIAKSKSFILSSFIVGVLLVLFATPDLTVPDFIDFENPNERFQGIAATFSLTFAPISKYILAILAGIGLSGLIGLWHCKDKAMLAASITFWSLVFGWLLYALTRGFVFDRFILTWSFLLPIVWIRILPKWLLIPQLAGLFFIAVWLTASWLF